jgi:hypothetical protein
VRPGKPAPQGENCSGIRDPGHGPSTCIGSRAAPSPVYGRRLVAAGSADDLRLVGVADSAGARVVALKLAGGVPGRVATGGFLDSGQLVGPVPASPPRAIGQHDQLAPGPDLLDQARLAPARAAHQAVRKTSRSIGSAQPP